MTVDSQPRWTIAELGSRVAAALSVDYPGPKNGQIRAIPNPRTIRYYTTIGLLDRAAEMRGRTAYYGPRHLLQLVAIKRLQAAGKSLEEVQQRLAGMPDSDLAIIANIPKSLYEERRLPGRAPDGRASAGRKQRFWTTPPTLVAGSEDSEASAVSGVTTPENRRDVRGAVRTFSSIPLGPGVSLLLEPARAVAADEIRRLREAAQPLLDRLAEHPPDGDPGSRPERGEDAPQ